jgi:hypothetical protein
MTPKTPAEQHLEVIEDAERILEDYHRTAPIETSLVSHPRMRRRLAESRINMLTGGDPVRARFMHQDLFEFTPQLKLVISGNHKPSLRSVGDDGRHSVGLHDDAPTFETRRHAEAVASTASSGSAAMRLSPDARNPTTGRMVELIANLELGRLNNPKGGANGRCL